MSNKEKSIKMYRSGKRINEIAQQLGIAPTTVKNYIHGIELEPTHLNKETISARWNKQRNGCRKCIYRNKGQSDKAKGIPGCNYILIVGHSRGCSIEDCNVFVKESRKKNV